MLLKTEREKKQFVIFKNIILLPPLSIFKWAPGAKKREYGKSTKYIYIEKQSRMDTFRRIEGPYTKLTSKLLTCGIFLADIFAWL